MQETPTRPLNIAIVNLFIEYYSPKTGGAISTVAMNQAKSLMLLGHKVTVLTPTDGTQPYTIGKVIPVTRLERHQLSYLQRALNKWQMLYYNWDWAYYSIYLRSVKNALSQLSPSPDIVICENDFQLPAYIKRLLPQSKVVVHLHNELKTKRTDLLQLQKEVDKFLCVSEYIADTVKRVLPAGGEKVCAILNGVDATQFSPRIDCLAIRPYLRVLFVGRINEEKAPDIVVKAVEALQAEGRDVRLTVAGSVWWYGNEREMQDPYFADIANALETMGAERLGHVERECMPEIFRNADVVVIPSRWNDPCPLVVLEAMASGCAVVASRRGGIPELCADAAILANPDQPDSFTSALRELHANATLLEEYKRRSICRAAELTWNRNVSHLLANVYAQSEYQTKPGAP